MVVGKRLQKICQSVKLSQGLVVDVGTDHAYVPINLALAKPELKLIAADIRPGPLKKAKANVEKVGLTGQIDCRLSDGLQAIDDYSIDLVIISGMGGHLISDILEWERVNRTGRVKEVLLSPQKDPDYLRRWLHRAGFAIVDESLVEENGFIYPIIEAKLGQQVYSSAIDYYYGKINLDRGDALLGQWLVKQRRQYEALINQLTKQCLKEQTCSTNQRLALRLTQLNEQLILIDNALRRMAWIAL